MYIGRWARARRASRSNSAPAAGDSLAFGGLLARCFPCRRRLLGARRHFGAGSRSDGGCRGWAGRSQLPP